MRNDYPHGGFNAVEAQNEINGAPEYLGGASEPVRWRLEALNAVDVLAEVVANIPQTQEELDAIARQDAAAAAEAITRQAAEQMGYDAAFDRTVGAEDWAEHQPAAAELEAAEAVRQRAIAERARRDQEETAARNAAQAAAREGITMANPEAATPITAPAPVDRYQQHGEQQIALVEKTRAHGNPLYN